MALAYTTTADVTTRWVGDDQIPADDAKIATLLEDAEDTILREVPDLAQRIIDGLPLLRIRKVAARMVIRHLRNPEGIRQQQDSKGPYSSGVTYGGEEPGALYLTSQDRAELGGIRSGGAFTIDTLPQPYTPSPPDPWVGPWDGPWDGGPW